MTDRYRDIPPSAVQTGPGEWDVDLGYTADEQARDDWLDQAGLELEDEQS